MIIINDQYAISSDKYQWKLMKKIKPNKTFPDGWKSFKYYTSLENAVIGLGNLLLQDSTYTTFDELKSNADGIAQLLNIKCTEFKVIYD